MKRCLFIIGAGASSDFGLPLGSELAVHIRDQLQGEIAGLPDWGPIFRAALDSKLPGNYGEAARDLAGGLVSARSIDRFLDSRKDRPLVIEIGKCGIAAAIMSAEGGSFMGAMPDERWGTIQSALVRSNSTWLARLFSLLQEGVRPADAHKIFENCAFVTFNYDRCIERYLRLALCHVLDQTAEGAAEIIAGIPLVHLYGCIGGLPDAHRNGGIPYGPPLDFVSIAARSIQTFTEGAADGTLEEIEKLVEWAEQLVFLGFAFDPLNVKALFRKPLRGDQTIVGTKRGVGSLELAHFHDLAFVEGGIRGPLYDNDCASFMSSIEFRAAVDL